MTILQTALAREQEQAHEVEQIKISTLAPKGIVIACPFVPTDGRMLERLSEPVELLIHPEDWESILATMPPISQLSMGLDVTRYLGIPVV